MTTTSKQDMRARIQRHGEQLLAIFPRATERDPVNLCRKLRRLESHGARVALRLCNGPEYAEGDVESIINELLARVNKLLGNHSRTHNCRCGHEWISSIARSHITANISGEPTPYCPMCGKRAVQSSPAISVPVFINRDPRGYALKIDDHYMREHDAALHQDWGGYGIIAPDLSN